MTQEEKDLLLQDLSARLPFGVKCTTKVYKDAYVLKGILDNKIYLDCPIYDIGDDEWDIELVIPYLRPMSSMTEEEKEEFENLLEGIVDGIERWDKPDLCEEYNWLNSHHIDYHGLIPMGLANEAPEDMYK